MSDVNKRVILITYLGLVPFYFPILIELIGIFSLTNKIIDLDKLHFLYGSMIVAFLSGMQWQKIIIKNSKSKLLLPMIPLILVAFFGNDNFIRYPFLIVIFSLFLSLIIDLLYLKKVNELWFKRSCRQKRSS